MIYTTKMLIDKYKSFSNVFGKINRLEKTNNLYQITKGLYEDNKNTPGYLLAGSIYGPSYLSFDYALMIYGLIPEAVYSYTSATYDKKKTKEYHNYFGTYYYRDVPKEVYPYGIRVVDEKNYSYLIATKEKALCDKLYTMKPVHSVKDLKLLLFEDLRIDINEFNLLNIDDVIELCKKYKSNNLKYLEKMMRRKIKHE